MTVAPWIIAAHKSGEWLETRGAGKRRVICVDAPGRKWPVITIDPTGSILGACEEDGRCPYDDNSSLIPPRREWEVCVYGDDAGCVTVRFDYEPRPPCYKLLARATLREGDV